MKLVIQILYFTPRWVFGMLGGLVLAGLLQARTRRIPLWFALLFPAAMLVLSISGVVTDAGLSWPALSAWTVGMVLTATFGARAMRPEVATYDAASGKLTVAGSWVPLVVLLGIFCVRYAVGIVKGMQLDIGRSPVAVLSSCAALGALSGFFVARGLVFRRVASARSVRQGVALPR